jgi:septal ring factor EnvC (AmiA/AmiB activator)
MISDRTKIDIKLVLYLVGVVGLVFSIAAFVYGLKGSQDIQTARTDVLSQRADQCEKELIALKEHTNTVEKQLAVITSQTEQIRADAKDIKTDVKQLSIDLKEHEARSDLK